MLSSCHSQSTRENDRLDVQKGDSCISIFYAHLQHENGDSIASVLASNLPKEEFLAYLDLAKSRMGTIESIDPVETYSTVLTKDGVIFSIDIRSKVRVVRTGSATLDDVYLTGSDFSHWKVSGYTMNFPNP